MTPMHPGLARLRLQAEVDAARARLAQPTDTLDAIAGDGNGNVAIPGGHDVVCRDAATGRVVFATNPDLHEIQEGEALTLIPMDDRSPRLWYVPPKLAELYGLFVAAYTADATDWKILRFVDLPSTAYTDLGYAPGRGANRPLWMAVAGAALFVLAQGVGVLRYAAGAWSEYALPSGTGTIRTTKHSNTVLIARKAVTGTEINLWRCDPGGVLTQINAPGGLPCATAETLVQVASMTPTAAGSILFQLANSALNLHRLVRYTPADNTFVEFTASPAYLSTVNRDLDWLACDAAGRMNAIAHTPASDRRWLTSDDGQNWTDRASVRFFIDDEGTETEEPQTQDHSTGGDTGYYADGDDLYVGTHVNYAILHEVADFGLRVAPANHYGPDPFFAAGSLPEPGVGTLSRLYRLRSGEAAELYLSSYLTRETAPEAWYMSYWSAARVGARLYLTYGLNATSGGAFVPRDPPHSLGLFVLDLAGFGLDRFLPESVAEGGLGVNGGCGLMIAHDVTEAAAV